MTSEFAKAMVKSSARSSARMKPMSANISSPTAVASKMKEFSYFAAMTSLKAASWFWGTSTSTGIIEGPNFLPRSG